MVHFFVQNFHFFSTASSQYGEQGRAAVSAALLFLNSPLNVGYFVRCTKKTEQFICLRLKLRGLYDSDLYSVCLTLDFLLVLTSLKGDNTARGLE